MASRSRKKQFRGFKRWCLVAVIFLLVCVSLVVWMTFTPMVQTDGQWKEVRVKPGASLHSVANSLARASVIRNAWLFEHLIARRGQFEQGLYRFRTSERPIRIYQRLIRGDWERVRITIPEGFTLDQIGKRLYKANLIDNEAAFLSVAEQAAGDLVPFLQEPLTLEGYLFPDTYIIPVGMETLAILELMHSRQRDVLSKVPNVPTDPTALHRLITIASMIEREAITDRDRPLVASVLGNRLRKGMRLQIDATVQYALGRHVNRVLYSHLRVDNPYNTYRNKGLPPGPIANPGLRALTAAANPALSPYLFYVLGPDRKNHVFTTSYRDHLVAVRKYRARP